MTWLGSVINIDASINENDDPKILLQALKAKNKDRPIVAHININFLNPKFEALRGHSKSMSLPGGGRGVGRKSDNHCLK